MTYARITRTALAFVGSDIAALIITFLPFENMPISYTFLFCGVALLGFVGAGLYRPRISLQIMTDVPNVLGMVVVATLAAGTAAGINDPRLVLATLQDGAVAAVLIIGGRAATYTGIRTARRRGRVTYRTLIVGTGSVGARLTAALEMHSEYGLRVVGVVGRPKRSTVPLPYGLVWDDDDLRDVVERQHISVVILAFGGVSAGKIVEALRHGPSSRCTVFYVPRLFEILRSARAERVRDIPVVRVSRPPSQTAAWQLKRLTDIVVAFLALLTAWPVFLVTALAVRIECGRGVIFRQERVGRGGKTFTVYKFRSMTPASEAESATKWTVRNDQRLGPVGRFIRGTSLDELPQLLNVLRGEMSLVGPRPERPHFVTQFCSQFPSYALRHRVPPGMTGWAAVNGLRGDTSIEERAYYDNVYIESWSLWLDLTILLRTITAVLGVRGA